MKILNVESPGVIGFISGAGVSVREGESVPITVRRSGGSNGPVSVRYTVGNNLAVPSVSRVEWLNGDSADKIINITGAVITGDQSSLIVLDDPQGGATLGPITQKSFTVTDVLRGVIYGNSVPITVLEGNQFNVEAGRFTGNMGAVSIDYTISNSLGTPTTGTISWADGEDGIHSVQVSAKLVGSDESGIITLSNPQGGAVLNPAYSPQSVTVRDTGSGVLNLTAFPASVDEKTTTTLYVTRDNGSTGAASCEWVMPGMTPSYGSFSWTDGDTATKSVVLTANYIYEPEDGVIRHAHLLNITGAGNGGTVRRTTTINWVDSVKSTTDLTVYDASNSGVLFQNIQPPLPGSTQLVTVLMDDIFPAGQTSLPDEEAWLPNQAHINALGTALENAGITEVVLDIEYVAGDIGGTLKWDYNNTNQAIVENCAALWVQVFTYLKETYTGQVGMYGGASYGLPDYAAHLMNPAKDNVNSAGDAAFLANKYLLAAKNAEWMSPAHDEADFIAPSIYARSSLAYNDYNTGHWGEVGYDSPYYWCTSITDQRSIDVQTYRFIDYLMAEFHTAAKRKIWYIVNRFSTSARYDLPDGVMLWQMNELTQYADDDVGIWSAANINPGGVWGADDIAEYSEYTALNFGTINIATDVSSVNELSLIHI